MFPVIAAGVAGALAFAAQKAEPFKENTVNSVSPKYPVAGQIGARDHAASLLK